MKHLTLWLLLSTVWEASALPKQLAAQNPSRDSKVIKSREAKAEAELLRQQALTLLDQEIDRAKLYGQSKDRIIVISRIADVIWNNNPERGRQLLRDAYLSIATANPEPSEGESTASVSARAIPMREMLRSEVFSIAQKHDPDLFQEFLKTIRENPKRAAELHNRPESFGSSSFQKRALVDVALKLATSDPDKAIEYAINSLGYGVPEEFGALFKVLVFNDREHAKRLFSRATDVFVADGSSNLYDALILVSYLRIIPQPEPDIQLVQRFLNGTLERLNRVRLMSQNSKDEIVDGALLLASRQMYPFFRFYWPQKASELEALIRQVAGTAALDQTGEELIPRELAADTIEAKIARAEEEKNEEDRDALYLDAGLMLAREGNYARAIEIAGRANNLEKRAAVFTYIYRQESEQLIKKGEFFNASRVIGRIEDPELRVEAIVLFAKIGRKKAPELTRSLLEDTRRLLENNVGSNNHARSYLWLASAYAVFDPVLSFELMTSAVRFANKTKGFNSTEPEFKLIYLSRKSGKAVPVGTAKGDFLSGFKLLARSDFWQAVGLAEKFDSQFLRGITIVAVAEPILNPKDVKGSNLTKQVF